MCVGGCLCPRKFEITSTAVDPPERNRNDKNKNRHLACLSASRSVVVVVAHDRTHFVDLWCPQPAPPEIVRSHSPAEHFVLGPKSALPHGDK